jgi:hypothetical protein
MVVVSLLCLPIFAEAAVINGGFEDDWTGWTNEGSTAVVGMNTGLEDGQGGTVYVDPVEGESMAAITMPGMSGMVWENYIYQDITLGPGGNILKFWYFAWTYDEAPFDNPAFLVEINDETKFSISAGEIGGDDVLGWLDVTGWQEVALDISGYYDPTRPASIRLSFLSGSTGDMQYASGAFIDGVEIVPIPTTLFLLGLGLIGLVGFRRKFRKS